MRPTMALLIPIFFGLTACTHAIRYTTAPDPGGPPKAPPMMSSPPESSAASPLEQPPDPAAAPSLTEPAAAPSLTDPAAAPSLTDPAAAPSLTEPPAAIPALAQRVRIAAHRGGTEGTLENSLPAFLSAMALGVDFLELDVHLTRDGQLIVLHDATLERTTTGSGAVAERTALELAALHLKDPAGQVTDDDLPTLDALLSRLDDHTQLLLEIKTDASRRPYPGIEARIVELLTAHGMLERTIVMSFKLEYLARLRRVSPDVRLGGLLGPGQLEQNGQVAGFLAQLEAVGAEFAGLERSLITPEVAAVVHGAGLLLGAWTVDRLELVDQLLPAPVDVVITNRPGAVLRHLGSSDSSE